MKYVLLSILLCISYKSAGSSLIGQWAYDSDRTISGINGSSADSRKVKQCFISKTCSKGVVIEFTESLFRVHFDSDTKDKYRTEFTEYRVVKNNSNKITVKFLGENPKTRTYFVENKDSIYFTEEHNGFKWAEYLKRKP